MTPEPANAAPPRRERLLELFHPLVELLDQVLERQETLEAQLEELREASRPPRVMRAKDFIEWYRRELAMPVGHYPVAYQTVLRWWDDRAANGAEAWGAQEGKGATLWVDAWALLWWIRKKR